MERILQGLVIKICLVYLDDVIVFGKTFEDMVENFKQILFRFREANLKINPKKYNLFVGRQVKYLGHVITAEGISMDPEQIAAVAEWPVPQSKKQVRSFWGGSVLIIENLSEVFLLSRNLCFDGEPS